MEQRFVEKGLFVWEARVSDWYPNAVAGSRSPPQGPRAAISERTSASVRVPRKEPISLASMSEYYSSIP